MAVVYVVPEITFAITRTVVWALAGNDSTTANVRLTVDRRSGVVCKNLAIRSFLFLTFPLPDLHIIDPGAERWRVLRLNVKITAFGLRILSFVSVLVFVLFSFLFYFFVSSFLYFLD